MSVDVIHHLKKVLAEASRIVDWQMEVSTALRNIDASWIAGGRISWDRMPFSTWAELLSKLTGNVNDCLTLTGVAFTNGWRIAEDGTYGLVLVDSGGRKYRFVVEEVG